MKNKMLLLASLVLISGVATADQTILQGAATQAAPANVLEGANAIGKAQAVQNAVTNAPEMATNVVKDKVTETVKEVTDKAIPSVETPKVEATTAAPTVEGMADTAKAQASDEAAATSSKKTKKHAGKKHNKKRHH